jgi:hypothetical protein
LDVIAIALCLLGLSMLTAESPASHAIAALLVTMGYWFRFHFVLFPFIYVALLLIVQGEKSPWRHVAYAVLGVAGGFAVPMTVCYLGHGVLSLPVQKHMLAELSAHCSWAVSYSLALEHRTFRDILGEVLWGRTALRLAEDCAGQPAALVVLLVSVLQAERLLRKISRRRRSVERPGVIMADMPQPLLMVGIVLALVPFAYIRGMTERVAAGFVLMALPVMAPLAQSPRRRWHGALLAACIVCCLLPLPSFLSRLRLVSHGYKAMYDSVTGAMPRDTPAGKVLCASWFPNKRNKYWEWSPVLCGGWPLENAEMRKEFGVIDLSNASDAGVFEKFDYLILRTMPVFDFERFNPQLLKLGEVRDLGWGLLLIAVRHRGEPAAAGEAPQED